MRFDVVIRRIDSEEALCVVAVLLPLHSLRRASTILPDFLNVQFGVRICTGASQVSHVSFLRHSFVSNYTAHSRCTMESASSL